YVRRAWNARTGKLIYDHQRGRLSGKWYHLFDERDCQYLLPIRNWGWRSIRRVRCKGEAQGRRITASPRYHRLAGLLRETPGPRPPRTVSWRCSVSPGAPAIATASGGGATPSSP